VLCFPFRNWRTEGASHESGVHYTGNQGRDFKTESGTASAGRWSEEDDTGTAQNISGRQKKNCSGTESPVEESQGIKETENSLDLVRVPTPAFLEVGVFSS
jgi:hypothetical protein